MGHLGHPPEPHAHHVCSIEADAPSQRFGRPFLSSSMQAARCFLIRVDGWMDGLQLRIVGWLAAPLLTPKSQHAEEEQQTDLPAAGQSLEPRNRDKRQREREKDRARECRQQAARARRPIDRSRCFPSVCRSRCFPSVCRSRCFPSVCVSGGGGSAVLGWTKPSVTRLLHSLCLSSQAEKEARPCPLSFSSIQGGEE